MIDQSYTIEHGSLHTKVQEGIAYLTFSHPKSNSLTQELLRRLAKEIQSLSEDMAVKVIVLASEGKKAFCSGAALHEVLKLNELESASLFFKGFVNVILAIRHSTKPVVAAVQGKTVGGGLGILSACDVVYATESASIRLSELSIGIAPFVIEPAVSRKLGISGFEQLSWAPTRWKNAYWCLDKGLYHRVFDNIEEMNQALNHYLQDLVSYNPKAMELQKKIIWQNTDNWEELLSQRAVLTAQTVLSEFCKKSLERFR